MPNKPEVVIHWFRRDLRLNDNHALLHALTSGTPVLPIFIFDACILDKLEDKYDRRIDHIHRTLSSLQDELINMGSSLHVLFGKPKAIWETLLTTYSIQGVYANHDHESYGVDRDEQVRLLLEDHSIRLNTFKDISIFEREEILKDDGTPYKVFTPFSKKWKQLFTPEQAKPYSSEDKLNAFVKCPAIPLPTLEEIGFKHTDVSIPSAEVSEDLLRKYDKTRDFPALSGTSRLSVHLRFGTISPRKAIRMGLKHNEVFLNELIWREFYMMVMWCFPHAEKAAFRPKYDQIPWENNMAHFDAWCAGKTGYPMVDAGMRELNATGHMHNRVRMVVASFLTKHLLLDWRLGEAYFAKKLLDFELSSNNGGWQWASGSGCDAAPYFRVFNPELQLKKFDPNEEYVRYWLPEWGSESYPKPIVEHKLARKRAIERYNSVLKKGKDRTNEGQSMLF